jgi:hypothetical protein
MVIGSSRSLGRLLGVLFGLNRSHSGIRNPILPGVGRAKPTFVARVARSTIRAAHGVGVPGLRPEPALRPPCFTFCSSNHVASDIDLEKPVYFQGTFLYAGAPDAPDDRRSESAGCEHDHRFTPVP